jgi:D-xylonolactonase
VNALRRVHLRQLGHRFNDVIADPAGRVFAGTMAYQPGLARAPGIRSVRHWLQRRGVLSPPDVRTGALWRIGAGGAMVPVAFGLHRPNGMAFSPALTTLYVTESRSRRIYAYRYDIDRGLLSDARVFLDLAKEPGIPDGLVVDCEGCLWSARHKAGAVVRYAPSGHELTRVRFPTPAITSLVFGGSDNRDLYVTAGGADDLTANGKFAGALFRVRSPVAGGPVWGSRIGHA